MAVEVKILSAATEEEEEKLRRKAIEMSHEWMESLPDRDCKPGILMMCLAHTLGHILVAAPNETAMKASMLFFMQELDYPGLVKANQNNGSADDDDEDEIGEPISAAIN